MPQYRIHPVGAGSSSNSGNSKMASSFDKSVKGGTKVKLAPPKAKYVEHLLSATNAGEAAVGEVLRSLTPRLRDSTWTVAFKALIIVHLMIKEGAPNITLGVLQNSPKSRLAVNQFTDVQTQGHNIRRYSDYLIARATAFGMSGCDYVAAGDGRMKRMTVDKGLLRETEAVQDQIRALVKCDLLSSDVENEISLTAFRLLTRDLLDLYNVENEAMMNVLSRYFEMSKPDAERAVKIYKTFCKQTDLVVQYLQTARQYEHATLLQIPKIKHAPTSLVKSLQDYLDDTDFDVNRQQYLAEQDAKKNGQPAPKPLSKTAKPPQPAQTTAAQSNALARAFEPGAVAQPSQPARAPGADLIDFFESIEQNQQPMAQSAPQFQQQQQTGFPMQQQPTGYPAPQQQQAYGVTQMPQVTGMNGLQANAVSTNPFGQVPQQQQQQQPQGLQAQFTGAGFGGYGPRPPHQQPTFTTGSVFAQEPQQYANPTQPPPAPVQVQQTGSTNPFRQSSMPAGATSAFQNSAFGAPEPQRQSSNPFARSAQPPLSTSNFTQSASQQNTAFSPSPTNAPLQAQPTGTNPFARNITPVSQPSPLLAQPTGSTNPFRQSAFVNQSTGQAWQNAPQQATMGGLERLETVPVFPRPGQAPPVQQSQSPWG